MNKTPVKIAAVSLIGSLMLTTSAFATIQGTTNPTPPSSGSNLSNFSALIVSSESTGDLNPVWHTVSPAELNNYNEERVVGYWTAHTPNGLNTFAQSGATHLAGFSVGKCIANGPDAGAYDSQDCASIALSIDDAKQHRDYKGLEGFSTENNHEFVVAVWHKLGAVAPGVTTINVPVTYYNY